VIEFFPAPSDLLQVPALRNSAERRQLLRNGVRRVLLRPLSGRGEEPRRGHHRKQEDSGGLVNNEHKFQYSYIVFLIRKKTEINKRGSWLKTSF